MTERDLRQRVVEEAEKDLGAKQYSARHEQIIRDFNKIPGMGGMKDSYFWCAASVSVWGWRAGCGSIYYPSASCNQMIAKYRAHGRYIDNDAYIPKPGDLIMYNWDAQRYGDDRGEVDHVGLVTKVTGQYIQVIEGNRNNAVQLRTIGVDWIYTSGFCIPDFAKLATAEKDWVAALQAALNASYDLNLEIDGSCGPLTRQAIDHHYLWYIARHPIVNAHVSWLQSALNECGAELEVDGSFGPATDAALRDFQRRERIDVDGYAGIQTHLRLLKQL